MAESLAKVNHYTDFNGYVLQRKLSCGNFLVGTFFMSQRQAAKSSAVLICKIKCVVFKFAHVLLPTCYTNIKWIDVTLVSHFRFSSNVS